MAETEGLYDVVINEDKELLFIVKPRPHIPSAPRIFYDGGRRALLIRDAELEIIFDHLPPLTREYLDDVDKVLIAEFQPDSKTLLREYFAPISIVKELPL